MRTPGKWKQDNEFVVGMPEGTDGDYLVVCRKPSRCYMIDSRNDETAWEANSTLISAAPEMLMMLERIEQLGSIEFERKHMGSLRALVRKAKGE